MVLLPIIETQAGSSIGLTEQLSLVGATVAKGVGGLGAILVAGRFLLRPLFDVVAGKRERLAVCWKVSGGRFNLIKVSIDMYCLCRVWLMKGFVKEIYLMTGGGVLIILHAIVI